jgi:NAD-dependent SIR2 family protein deacetylase
VTDHKIDRAADAIVSADALVVAAGAGMGVDSGLPDFRGTEGFWRAYPPYRELGVSFIEMASPDGFHHDPELAWGFYGHRRSLYRRTRPHHGYALLQRLGEARPLGVQVFTSNVDEHFQAAGFDAVVECHGSIEWEQCLRRCGAGTWPASDREVEVDGSTMRAVGELPSCLSCGGLARPNILMFGDLGWDPSRTEAQMRTMRGWLDDLRGRDVVAIECGAGTAVPSVRRFSESLRRTHDALLVRVNPRETDVPGGGLGLARGALETAEAIADALDAR